MSISLSAGLYHSGQSRIHGLPAHAKILGTLALVACVVATPITAWAAFPAYALVLATLTQLAGLSWRWLAPRMLIEAPFLLLAVLLPFSLGGPELAIEGMALSIPGLLAAANLLVKGTLGVLAGLLLAGTTSPHELVVGFSRLRVPQSIVMILALMVRYVDVVVAESQRMRLARLARGDNPRFAWQLTATLRSLSSLFLRAYERGERVHLAMRSRGWGGTPGQKDNASPTNTLQATTESAPETVKESASQSEPRVQRATGGHASTSGLRNEPVPAVDLDNLHYAYPAQHHSAQTHGSKTRAVPAETAQHAKAALRGINLRIAPGERVALIGPNGAGKTTLALHLNGLLPERPGEQNGSVRISGQQLTAHSLPEVRQRVGLVFQDPQDQLFMPRVAEDVAFGPRNFGVTGPELTQRVQWALDAVGMGDCADRSPLQLSGGQRKRVALAAVLACQPDVLVLDEPTAGLDPVARRELIELLLALDTTLLVVTHDLPLALQLCPRSVLVSDGRVSADATTRELLDDTDLLAEHRLELPWGFSLG